MTIKNNMCYHDQKDFGQYYEDLMAYYSLANYAESFKSKVEDLKPITLFHNNGFDHNLLPVVTMQDGQLEVGMMQWGLIPFWTKTEADARKIRIQTLNAISEEMYDKPSFRDVLKAGQRCLIPSTGFYEWMWLDKAGKNKQPYYIHLKDQRIFSFAGIWSKWTHPETGQEVFTFSKLTCVANPMMEVIHNNKKRMPVIIPREYEKDWLNPNLTKEDVLAFCKPYDESKMEAWPISKLITSKTSSSNVPEVSKKIELISTGSLF